MMLIGAGIPCFSTLASSSDGTRQYTVLYLSFNSNVTSSGAAGAKRISVHRRCCLSAMQIMSVGEAMRNPCPSISCSIMAALSSVIATRIATHNPRSSAMIAKCSFGMRYVLVIACFTSRICCAQSAKSATAASSKSMTLKFSSNLQVSLKIYIFAL